MWVQWRSFGVVYLRQQGGTSQQLNSSIVRLLALDAKEFLTTTQAIVAGDFNARVGELSNEVEETKLKARSREDKVITARGRLLMREMNRAGLYLSNGVGGEAGLTYGKSGEGQLLTCCGAAVQ